MSWPLPPPSCRAKPASPSVRTRSANASGSRIPGATPAASHERLVLEILAQEHERSQQQHRNQHGGNPEHSGRSRPICPTVPSTRPAPAATSSASMASRGTTFFHRGSRLNSRLFRSHSRADKAAAAIHATVPDEGNIVKASRVVGAIRYRPVEELGTNAVQQADAKKMQIEPPPSAETGPCRQSEDRQQQGVLQQIEPVVGDVVEIDIQHHVLVRKHDEGVKEDPPSQQHQEIHAG